MHFLLIGIWLVVSGIVGQTTAQDLKQERLNHRLVVELHRQEREMKAIEAAKIR